MTDALHRLDSLRSDIMEKKFTFEDAAQYVSQDKDSKNNKGIMLNTKSDEGSTRFQMSELPQEIAKKVDEMQVGDISEPFIMRDPKSNREIVAIVKLKNRIEGHKANMSDDYQVLKNMYEESQREKIIEDWVKKKQNETFVRIEEGWKNCEFKYDGWSKQQ